MKTAIYIEEGTVQLVITPESEFEKNALSSFEDKSLSVQIFPGSFYDCRGGWIRQSSYYPSSRAGSDRSLILRISEPAAKAGVAADRCPYCSAIHAPGLCTSTAGISAEIDRQLGRTQSEL